MRRKIVIFFIAIIIAAFFAVLFAEDNPVNELQKLRAENNLLKQTLWQKDNKIKELQKQIEPIIAEAKQEPYFIEKFDFEWFVAESGDTKLIVRKTDETIQVILRGERGFGDSIYLPPADAEAIGGVLADVDKYFARMKQSENDISEDHEAGKYKVSFDFSKNTGFHIYIRAKDLMSFSSLSLERNQAKAFAPYLQKSKTMCQFLDKKIKF